ncbi:hypothetical protein KC343_g619 [Hortaea werneckii]|nr:hypothetical protein KC365_g11781 [Hortaea werneckii]KAI7288824.1 hypothetical protein KC352_g4080 [Hortaea werneckii]KAI7572580.1 hypothetical protein KC317_g627 [Hortaea werneckii]KAI7627742.1 hypothetical protein KC346_g588 [Hortaea werneckii]KAI7637578.1 hypothetical protein KC343_g619 [Hortaea werneckii]
MSLARYVTETDAAVFAIGMVLKELPSILSKTSHRTAEVATKSGLALAEIQNPHRWVQSSITDAKCQQQWLQNRKHNGTACGKATAQSNEVGFPVREETECRAPPARMPKMAQKARGHAAEPESRRNHTERNAPDQRNLKTLFENKAIVDMLEFVEKTEVGKRPPAVETHKADSWDIDRLDRNGEEDGDEMEDDA